MGSIVADKDANILSIVRGDDCNDLLDDFTNCPDLKSLSIVHSVSTT